MCRLSLVRLFCAFKGVLALALILGVFDPWIRADTSAFAAEKALAPLYKPSSRAPRAIDIRTPGYGASRTAPNALTIGDKVPDFVLPKAGGGYAELKTLREKGDVVIVFYRGHW